MIDVAGLVAEGVSELLLVLELAGGVLMEAVLRRPLATGSVLVIPRCSYCVCETGYYILGVFVVMSKEEGLCTVERPSYPDGTRPNEY